MNENMKRLGVGTVEVVNREHAQAYQDGRWYGTRFAVAEGIYDAIYRIGRRPDLKRLRQVAGCEWFHMVKGED